MSTITIRDLPEDIINIHKHMAAMSDRSFESHLRFVLREVISRHVFDCDNDEPVPFHRHTVVEYMKAFIEKFGKEATHFRLPYRGLLWHAVYHWPYDERGKKIPWALEDGEKFMGLEVELVPAILPEGSTDPAVLGSLTRYADIAKPLDADEFKTRNLYIYYNDLIKA